MKFLIPLWLPRDFHANPALAASPIGIPEHTSSVEVLILFQEVLEGNPEDGVIAELMVELFFDFSVPFLGTIGPGALPNTLSVLTPWISNLFVSNPPVNDLMIEKLTGA